MNFFKTKPRTPPDIVRGLREAVNRLEGSAAGGETRRRVSYGFTTIIIFSFLSNHSFSPTKMFLRICSRSKVSYWAMVVCRLCVLSYPAVIDFGNKNQRLNLSPN